LWGGRDDGVTFFIPLERSEPTPTSEREAEAAGEAARDNAGVVAPPPLIFLAGLAVGFGLEALLPGTSMPAVVQ
jgi:hypothetical protein